MSISVTALNKSYGEGSGRTDVLSDVDLTIEAGEFVAIVGTSGSGKTTLLNVIGGLDRDYTGSCQVEDRTLDAMNDKQLAELRNHTFGFVFQQFNLLDHLTARENVALPSFFERQATPPSERDFSDPAFLLDRVGLADKLDSYPTELSGGQQQRVAIARALYGHPTHILCDEPTGNLDRKTGLQIMETFTRLNRESEMTLVMVTHEEHIARMARRIVRLEDGRLISDEPNDPVEPDASTIVDTEGAAPSSNQGASS
jgi:putative ABC transport system ATP-binding protein